LAQLQVGYRVRDELALFVVHADEIREVFLDSEGEQVEPLDLGLTMKLLPRISGGSNLIRRLLRQLLGWARDGQPLTSDEEASALVSEWESAGAGDVLPEATYPRTAGRLCLMWSRLEGEGFTSYWL
jgi:5-methylcytosine-specific restriction enzyme B